MKSTIKSDKHFLYLFGDPSTITSNTNKSNKCHVILIISFLLIIITALILFILYTFNKIDKLENDIKELTNSINTLRNIVDEGLDLGLDDMNKDEDALIKIDEEYDKELLPDDEDFVNEKLPNGDDYYDYEEYDENNNNSTATVVIPADQYTKDKLKRKRSIEDSVPNNDEFNEEDRNKTSRILTTSASVQSRRNLWRPYHRKPKKYTQQNPDAESVEFRVERDEHRRGDVENFEHQPKIGRMRPLPTVHFSGDTSRYGIHHSNYRGNGHLRHLQKTFIDWKESNWVRNLGMDQHFLMEDGKLTIKETGLYFVYAQIYYLDVYDSNGFTVKKNSETILQCTVTFHSRERDYVGNTCYTAGVEYLMEDDVVSLKDLSEGRYTIFSPARSFFGVIKLGDVKM